ncbi:glutamate cyclase domain-containing protein [Bradyrhizobium sp. UFLA05-109]
MSAVNTSFAGMDDRLDRLVNLDLGGRGVEHLYEAARTRQGGSLCGAAAEALAAIPAGATVLMTTGSVSRAWISPTIGENDGPAGAAAIVRALALSKRVTCVVLAEETLLDGTVKILTSAGLSVLPYDQARIASGDGSLAVASTRSFPVTDAEAKAASASLLDELKPALVFSTERVGRNADGIYCSMRGIDYGMGRARIDYLFDEALARGIPSVCVGDGGNEIGMGVVADAVRRHVNFGDARPEGGAGIGAVTGTDVLVTAACSNWGCYAILGALAARLKRPDLLHAPKMEEQLLRRGVDIGLINSVGNVVDADVDGIPLQTHVAMADLISAIVRPAFR